MSSLISINIKLRPVRLGYLLHPQDASALRTMIHSNTVRWGGIANPILPVHRRLPKGFRRKLTPSQVVARYIDSFLPDYVVNMAEEPVELAPYPNDRVVTIDKVFDMHADHPVGYGTDNFNIFAHLYDTEFKFEVRHRQSFVLPQVTDRALRLFAAVAFGEFPDEGTCSYIKTAYIDAFDAKSVVVGPAELFSLCIGDRLTPLRVSAARSKRRKLKQVALFYLDASSAADLADFWNVRASGVRVVPIPQQWHADLLDIARDFVVEEQAVAQDSRHMPHTPIMMSRFCDREAAEGFAAAIRSSRSRINLEEWEPPLRHGVGYGERTKVTWSYSKAESRDVTVSGESMSFDDLAPESSDDVYSRGASFINVIEFRHYSYSIDACRVLPPSLNDWRRVVESVGIEGGWVTREGITIPCSNSWRQHWKIPTSLKVMSEWMRERGVTLSVSSAGRIALQMLRQLGGPFGMNILASREVVSLLNSMAHGEAELEVDVEGVTTTRRKALSPTAARHKVLQILSKENDQVVKRVEQKLQHLTENKVLRVGLRLKCPNCGQHTWFGLGDIRDSVVCGRCLQEFAFPAHEPPKNEWSYRVAGPFAVENYAQGGYATVLAMRFLTQRMHAEATWLTACDLLLQGGEKLEADFIGFWTRDTISRSAPSKLVFGECKSFNNPIEKRDIDRMGALGSAFPGATLVFCTLRDSLNADEKRRLSSFAKKVRRLEPKSAQTPVVILTGTELFSAGFRDWWEDHPAKDKIDAGHLDFMMGLRRLADLTQRIHLDLEPFDDWKLRQFETRLAREQKKSAGPGNEPSVNGNT